VGRNLSSPILIFRSHLDNIHGGRALQTDHDFHNIGIPQLGPGMGAEVPLDVGHGAVSGRSEDRFTFRTPPLRNVVLTGPWMHNGAYTTLEAAIRHYRNPRAALLDYDASPLDPRLASLLHLEAAPSVLTTLDSVVSHPLSLSDADVAMLIAFLKSLTDPAAFNQLDQMPDQVPSGLPLFD
jgi:cytochrome c peroxidase